MSMRLKTRLLILDQDEDFAQGISNILGGHRYEVLHATNVVEGLDTCMTFLPSVIIIDVTTEPRKSFAFIKEVKKYPQFAQAPIILTGNNPTKWMIQMARAFNVTDFLAKPLQNQMLLQKIRKVMLDQEMRRIELERKYSTECEISVHLRHQIENVISFEAPVKLSVDHHFKLVSGSGREISCQQGLQRTTNVIRNGFYCNTLSFDPVQDKEFLVSKVNPNFVYYMEEMIAVNKPRILILERDPKVQDQFELLMKKFKASYLLKEQAKKLEPEFFNVFDIIICSISDLSKDLKCIEYLTSNAVNPAIFLCGTEEELARLPQIYRNPNMMLPRPLNRNFVLFSLAKALVPSVIKKELWSGANKNFSWNAKIHLPINVCEVSEKGLVMESHSLIQKGTECKVQLNGPMQTPDIYTVDVLVKETSFNSETSSYEMKTEFSYLSSYQRAAIIYQLQRAQEVPA